MPWAKSVPLSKWQTCLCGSFRARSAVKLGADNDDELTMPRASKVVEGEALCELAKRFERCRKLVLVDSLILAKN